MNRKSINLICSIVILIIFITQLVNAQDSHYWIHQYGTRADLLSGLVVGSVSDLSSTYYNPGAIPLSPEQSLVLTTNAFEFSQVTAKDAAENGVDLSSTQSGNSPGIFAARLTSSKALKNHLAFSFLTRHNFKFQIDGRRIDDRNSVQTGNPAQEYFSGELIVHQKLDEYWGGLSYGRNIGKSTAFGITQYISYRSQRGRYQTIGQNVDLTGNGSAAIFYRDFDYYNMRTLWKLGMAFDYRPLSFGFNLTTPSISLFGSGSTLVNLSIVNPDSGSTSIDQSMLVSDFQKDLSAYYRSPLSIAIGAHYRYKKTSLYFTMEWFDKVDRFTVMKPEDFIGQTTGQVISQTYEHELKSVINVGLGYQHTFHERLSLYGSVITDRSAKIRGSLTPFATSNWDIYHITAGSSLTFWRLDMIVGLTFSFGQDQFDREVSFDDESISDIIEDRVVLKDIYYRRVKVIIGFSILSADRSQN